MNNFLYLCYESYSYGEKELIGVFSSIDAIKNFYITEPWDECSIEEYDDSCILKVNNWNCRNKIMIIKKIYTDNLILNINKK